MIKRKIISIFICMSLAAGSLCGCDFEVKKGVYIDDEEETVEEGITEGVDSAEGTAPADGTFVQELGGGSPWLCSEIKANLSDSMDLSPKDDFHLYVNYDWLMENEIADGKRSRSSFSEVEEAVEEKARMMLTDKSLTGHDVELIQSLYDAYLDWDARDKAGIEPAMETVNAIRGVGSLDELSDFLCDPDKSVFIKIIEPENSESFSDSEHYLTMIDTNFFMLGDSAEYENRTESGESEYDGSLLLAKAMLGRIGIGEDEAQAVFEDVIAFEGKLAEASMSTAEQASPDFIEKISNNLYEPQELDGIASVFPLRRIVDSWGYGDAKEYNIYQPDLIKRMDSLYVKDNLETMKNWLLIHYLTEIASYLDSEAYDAFVEMENTKNGSSGRKDYESVVFETIRDDFSVPLDRAYIQKYDVNEMKERITQLCGDMVDAYRDMLKATEWLTEDTRQKAIEKLDAITINAVYPDKWEDYSSLDLSDLSLFDCRKEMWRYNRDLNLMKTGGTVDPEIWSDGSILKGNAYYHPQGNSINILLGILDEPFYHEGISDEELYGGIGTVIGHEISHAFDTRGAQFDKDGNVANWWADEDLEAFQKRAQRLIDYYESIEAWEGEHIRGSNNQGEAMADMAGVKVLLKIAESDEDFDYDAFFKAFARIWRRMDTREFAYLVLTQDPHPFNYLRTNVTLQQFDEFNETYDITEQDAMYLAPDDRILVW